MLDFFSSNELVQCPEVTNEFFLYHYEHMGFFPDMFDPLQYLFFSISSSFCIN